MKANYSVVLLCLILAGCASVFGSATVVPSAVPITQPLVPASIHLPSCEDVSDGTLTVPGKRFCMKIVAAMYSAFFDHEHSNDLSVVGVPVLTMMEGNAVASHSDNKTSARRVSQARYKVALSTPVSRHDVRYYGNGPVDMGIHTFLSFHIVDTTSGKTIAKSTIELTNSSPRDVGKKLMLRLEKGLPGPRCEAHHREGLQASVECDSFSLPQRSLSD